MGEYCDLCGAEDLEVPIGAQCTECDYGQYVADDVDDEGDLDL